MNFVDLYINSQKKKIKYIDESTDIIELYTPENIELYQECSLCLLEAKNFFDIVDIKYKDIKLYSEGMLTGFIGFIKTAISLWVKILTALGPMMMGIGIALMSAIFVIKALGKTGSINSSSGGGGGGFSSSSLNSAKAMTEAEFLYSKVENRKNENATNLIRNTEGYDKTIGRLVKIIEANKNEGDAKKRFKMSNIVVGVDKFNDGAFALLTENTFLIKAIKKYLNEGKTFDNKSFTEFINKQPFSTILGVKEMNKAFIEKTNIDWSKAGQLHPFTAYSADCLVNCDKFMVASTMGQILVSMFIAVLVNGKNQNDAENEIRPEIEALTAKVLEGMPSEIIKKFEKTQKLTEELSDKFDRREIDLDGLFLGIMKGCKFPFDSINKYIQVSKLYTSLKSGDLTKIKMDIHEIASDENCRFLDIIYSNKEHKDMARELVEAVHLALKENGFDNGRLLRERIKLLQDNAKGIKDIFDKIPPENFKDPSIYDISKTAQEFSIDILGMLQSIINIAPALYNNVKSNLYGIIKVDIMRIISAMWDDAFDKYNESK